MGTAIQRHLLWIVMICGGYCRSGPAERHLERPDQEGGRILRQPEPAAADRQNTAERVDYDSKVNWRQLLHDFMHFDDYDYTFLPPDRRFSDQDFFLPAFHICEEEGRVPDVWICVDTSASVCEEELSDLMAEIWDAMRQTGMTGIISFFDSSVTDPEPFSSEEELKAQKPVGGGGTSFYAIFRYLKEHIYPALPRAILIFTDGYAECPQEEAALRVPVLWLISRGAGQISRGER